jgi:hypothetical protein
MNVIPPRALSDAEQELLKHLLELGGLPSAELSELRVVGVCGCGCASINFVDDASMKGTGILVDLLGATNSGIDVGVPCRGGE